MPTRNLILWIIGFTFIFAIAFSLLFFRSPNRDNGAEEKPNFFATVWPFGRNNDDSSPNTDPTDISGYEPVITGEELPERLKKISLEPVSGYGVYLKERYGETEIEQVPHVRYADKATTNIYQTFADKIDIRKFGEATIPNIYESIFGNKGDSLILRYLSTDGKSIQTYNANLPKEVLGGDISSTANSLEGSFLPENISEVAISHDKTKLFYILPAGDGVVGISVPMGGGTRSQIFDSSYSEWLAQWSNDRMISITTKPSARVAGFMYSVDPVTKGMEKILGGINGLTTSTSPSGRKILYADNTLSLKIFDRGTRETTSAGIRTMPEKCIWGEESEQLYCAVPKYLGGNNYPDTWYQGETYFNDEIWRMDTASGNGTLLADPLSAVGGEDIDAINLTLDPTGKYLFFMNKMDSYLWMLEL
ncbi:MAG TPA: hypothetical protein VFQ59_01095 [Candidatus Paceibacterota bacterium]|nr:hypothetical protein [Candidatus Paceibacterota bacterium]